MMHKYYRILKIQELSKHNCSNPNKFHNIRLLNWGYTRLAVRYVQKLQTTPPHPTPPIKRQRTGKTM